MEFSNVSSITRTKLGLDDPRVTKCLDRGDNFYRQDHSSKEPIPYTSAASPSGSHDVVSTIQKELDDARISYPSDSISQRFVPRDKLSSIMTPERVRLVIKSLQCCDSLSPEHKDALTREICIGGRKWCRKPCLKLLTVLIAAEIQNNLLNLIEDHITDYCLPFELVPGTSDNWRCQIPDHHHSLIINKCGRQVERFCQWTYTLSAPYFKRPPGGHVHYILGVNDVLPIIEENSRGSLEAPLQRTKRSESPSREGGFSEIERVKFHSSHFDFGSYSVRHLVNFLQMNLSAKPNERFVVGNMKNIFSHSRSCPPMMWTVSTKSSRLYSAFRMKMISI